MQAIAHVVPVPARRFVAAFDIGTELGRTATLLIAQPIESYFAECLSDVRRKFGLSDPQLAVMHTSGTSVSYGLVFATKKGPVLAVAVCAEKKCAARFERMAPGLGNGSRTSSEVISGSMR